jgi:hypothetical protein
VLSVERGAFVSVERAWAWLTIGVGALADLRADHLAVRCEDLLQQLLALAPAGADVAERNGTQAQAGGVSWAGRLLSVGRGVFVS